MKVKRIINGDQQAGHSPFRIKVTHNLQHMAGTNNGLLAGRLKYDLCRRAALSAFFRYRDPLNN